MRLRYGLAGYGRIGRLIASIVPVARVADPLLEGGSRTHEELLGEDIDAIIVATPPVTHYPIARDALNAGKHVIVEKPPAATSAEARQLAEVAEANGAVLIFAYHARFNAAVEAAAGIVTSIRAIRAVFKENVLNFHSPGSWVFGEGVMRDSGINVLSVITHLLAGEQQYTCVKSDVRKRECAAVEYLAGSVPVSLDMDWQYLHAEVRRIEIDCDAGAVVIDISHGRATLDGAPIAGQMAPRDMLRHEYEHMLRDCEERILQGRGSSSDLELRLLEMAGA